MSAPLPPWTEKKILAWVTKGDWWDEVSLRDRKNLPIRREMWTEDKDWSRIKNLLWDWKTDAGGKLRNAQKMARLIKSFNKAFRRGVVCQYIAESTGAGKNIPSIKEPERAIAAQMSQIFYHRAFEILGYDLPLRVTVPSRPAKPQPVAPPIPPGLVPMTVEGWELYDIPGASAVARSLGKVMENALKSVGKNVIDSRKDATNARLLEKIIERVNKACWEQRRYGASDTEPRGVMYHTFEEYLKTYLDDWDYPQTFQVARGW